MKPIYLDYNATAGALLVAAARGAAGAR